MKLFAFQKSGIIAKVLDKKAQLDQKKNNLDCKAIQYVIHDSQKPIAQDGFVGDSSDVEINYGLWQVHKFMSQVKMKDSFDERMERRFNEARFDEMMKNECF